MVNFLQVVTSASIAKSRVVVGRVGRCLGGTMDLPFWVFVDGTTMKATGTGGRMCQLIRAEWTNGGCVKP
jgi:hypothetical protein